MFHCTVRYVTPLCDAWVEANGVDGGETSETPSNSYTHRFVQGEIFWPSGYKGQNTNNFLQKIDLRSNFKLLTGERILKLHKI